jgi:hypothetical protein
MTAFNIIIILCQNIISRGVYSSVHWLMKKIEFILDGLIAICDLNPGSRSMTHDPLL